MKKKSTYMLSSLIIIVLCMIIGFAALLISNNANKVLFKYHFKYAENQRIEQYFERVRATSILLDNLQYELNYTCDNQDIDTLEHASYFNAEIRRLSLRTPNGITCGDMVDTLNIYAKPKQEIYLNQQISLIANTSKDRTIIQYHRQILKGFMTVDITPQDPISLLKNECDGCWLQTVEGNGIILYTGNANRAESKIFNSPLQLNKDLTDQVVKPILSMPLLDNAWIKYYVADNVIQHYRENIRPYLIILLCSLTLILLVLMHRRFHNGKMLTFLLIKALKQNRLIPFYQPIVNAETNHICGYEVLMRWETKKGKIIPPDVFIPEAELNGLIVPMTVQLIETVAKDIKRLEVQHSIAPLPHYFSINVSPDLIQSTALINVIKMTLNKFKLQPHNFSFELTERTPISDFDKAKNVCDSLNELGIQVKLDDVGNGYCDFLALQKLQASTIKIDKIFVKNICDHNGMVIIESIVAFADKAEVEVIAEGIENREQASALLRAGVKYHQGYYYGKPVPFDKIKFNLFE